MTALDFPNNPATNDTYSSGGYTWRFDGTRWKVAPSTNPTYQTALPSSPVDGQEIYYQASGDMTTNGIIWHLRYRSAARSNAGAWEFVGGGSLHSGPLGAITTTSGTYVDLTNGPTLTVPRLGTYQITYGAKTQNFQGALSDNYVRLKKNTDTVSTTNSTFTTIYDGAYVVETIVQELATSAALKIQVAVFAGKSIGFGGGFITIQPHYLNPL